MKKQEIVNYFKTYNKSAKISVLADLFEHNVISAEMLNSAQRIVLNRRTRKKLIKEISMKNGMSMTPFTCARKHLIFEFNDSAEAFVLRPSK